MIHRKDGNTMKQNDILDSIGGISDSIIEDALSYTPEKKSAKKFSVKRLSTIAAAAVLCIILTVTCFANATEISAVISSLFRREQEYIDPYAQIINKSDTQDNILMTMRKVVKDGDSYILYLSLHNETEDFEVGYLAYDSIYLDYKSRGETCRYGKLAAQGTVTIAGRKVIAGEYFTNINKPTKDVDLKLVIPAGSKSEHLDPNICREWESGSYHFEINGLSVLPCSSDEKGLWVPEDEYIEYADKLEVDFDYDTSDVEDLPTTILYPNSDFELDGTNFRITKVVHTATSLKVTIEDMDKELMEYGDLHFWGTEKFAGYISPVECPWLPVIDDAGDRTGFKSGLVKDGKLDLEAEREWREKIYSVKKEYKLFDTIYSPQIIFKDSDCRESGWEFNLWPLNPDGTLNMNVYEITYYFNTATSPDDILAIDFLSWEYDYSKEAPEPKALRSKVTGWIN